MNHYEFKNTPLCEKCGKEPAFSFSYFRGHDELDKWMFTGACTTAIEDYYIEFDRFFKSPEATVDWIAHMNEKSWMDWDDFAAMMGRLRGATSSFWKAGARPPR